MANGDLPALMTRIGDDAAAAAGALSRAGRAAKDAALRAAAGELRARRGQILSDNAADLGDARKASASAALLDRLALDDARIEAMARGLEDIAALPDPIGTVTAEWQRPNGLVIQRVRVPLGVIGIVYESRPNVTADAGALCLKSGQRRDPARRERERALVHGDPPLSCRGTRGRGSAGNGDTTRANDRPRRGGTHARRSRWAHRRAGPARRQEPGRARAARSACAGHRAPRG